MKSDVASAVFDRRRLASVVASGLLDSEPEEAFDRLAKLAAKVLGAPYAFVTVVDRTRSFWKSCVGINGVRQNSVDESFCQYVIGSGQPLLANDAATNPVTRDNPSIEAMGIGAWAGVPLRAPDGQVLGSFCVVDTVPRQWTEDDIDTLRTLSQAATGEIEMRTALDQANTFAATLQRSLLPAELPDVRGIDLAAGHVPANDGYGVLGDFYDVFETQPGRWWVLIGDVRGHGVDAAETVTAARWSIRATAARTEHPSAVLDSVNRMLVRRPDIDAPHLTAVLLTFAETDEVEMRRDGLKVDVAIAGHPPPIVCHGEGAEALAPSGRPLGIVDDAKMTTTSLRLRTGHVMVLYTDGVTEARRREGQMMGVAGLCDILAFAADDVPAEQVLDGVVSAARGSTAPVDDIAAVVLRPN